MTIIPILLKFGPWLLAAAGVLFGIFRHQQAATATAKAQATVARAAAESEASNAAAAQVGQQAAAAAAGAQQQAAATPDSDLDAQLGQIGALRKD
ncbi:hypothetical protein [Burkholderia cenocepacia]|uniref:hypothetical protein n=1 Tax=Burkholderia cenocepacia TaxID=95486 RepID=UPI00201942B1|nr:hypothetical protein [Burkholderia cenocepacia]MCO1396429.1 hypothetical protein [Burkholderia cenocepacia]MCO1409003.1 hypothetical protein [Burkholderia cenocepacia]UQN92022.1 hypothetical protein L0Z06_14980 [Burkholderia cenocepacia]UQN99171.1 hypothetical protein L0Z39_16770 [Burkholderia cenocepacia]UQP50874.1 hypothetical protein L0Y99_10475 [Burkholderia cenocepacia]